MTGGRFLYSLFLSLYSDSYNESLLKILRNRKGSYEKEFGILIGYPIYSTLDNPAYARYAIAVNWITNCHEGADYLRGAFVAKKRPTFHDDSARLAAREAQRLCDDYPSISRANDSFWELTEVHQPTLILHGSLDPSVLEKDIKPKVSSFSNVTYLELEQKSHYLNQECVSAMKQEFLLNDTVINNVDSCIRAE